MTSHGKNMDRAIAMEGYKDGFTLLELLILLAVGLIVTAIALPIMSNVVANQKLRASMTSISGLLQNTRMVAVHDNKTKTACHCKGASCPASAEPHGLVYFAKDGTTCTTTTVPLRNDPQVELEAPITPMTAPSGPGAPPTINNSDLGLLSNPLTTDPSFNSRGLPCLYVNPGTCSPNNGFIQYFRDDRIGSGAWAAISITPAGRFKRWFWNGTVWTE